MSDFTREFGKHVRSLRRSRSMTQEVLAKRSGLSADTIRRIEHGGFAASIETLRKLCVGLDITQSTIFEGFELGRSNPRRELFDLITSRSDDEIAFMTRVVRALADAFDASEGETE